MIRDKSEITVVFYLQYQASPLPTSLITKRKVGIFYPTFSGFSTLPRSKITGSQSRTVSGARGFPEDNPYDHYYSSVAPERRLFK